MPSTSGLQSHLTVLESSASLYSAKPVFKLAVKSQANDAVESWTPISYKAFHSDVELAARYWSKHLSANGVASRSVVGLWLAGMDYSDVVNIYGISRAGYVPQLFSLRLPNPTVVYELLGRGQAKAIIVDRSFKEIASNPPVPLLFAASIADLDSSTNDPLPLFPTPESKDDPLFVFHTSGSTSGSPKLVTCSAAWVDSIVVKSGQCSAPKNSQRQDASTWMGSVCHIAQTTMFIGSLQHGGCTIQPTKIQFSSEELGEMIIRCGLNRLHQFASFLSTHIRHARNNPKLLCLLQSLDCVLYSGLPLPKEEEEFAYSNGINLVNLFGSTEVSAMLLSEGGSGPSARWLRPLKGVNYGFIPISSSAQSEAVHVSANSQLHELVILSDSPDCPDESLRSKADGHFHTGDLFQEMQPGLYLARGRDDDWIKSLNSLRCDTKAIEDNLRATCADLVDECIVVGTGRPSPALFIEPATNMEHEKLKREIVRRTRQFHARRYLHEQITSEEFIVVVPPKTLPRTATKGNIRRKAVEERFKDLLDEIFDME